MNKNVQPFNESELANAIGLLVIRSSELDYLLRSALTVFIAEDISDNRIYEKSELIVTKFRKAWDVLQLLEDLTPRVLCCWYWEDFSRLFTEVKNILNKRNSHAHQVFHILDEDTYRMSSATDHHQAKMGKSGPRIKLQEKHSLNDLKELEKSTVDCISHLEYLMGIPSKGPILRNEFLKLSDKEKQEIAERENDPENNCEIKSAKLAESEKGRSSC